MYQGKPETTIRRAQEAKRLSEETQIPIFLAASWTLEGFGHYYQDNFAAARKCADKSISLMLEHRIGMFLSIAYILSGLVSWWVGELAKARNALEEAMKVARDSDQKHYEGQARVALGRLTIDEDASQMVVAEQTILEGTKMVEDLQLRPLEVWGHLFLGGDLRYCRQEKEGTGQPEESSDHVPGDGHGLLPGQDGEGAGEAEGLSRFPNTDPARPM